MGQKGVVFSTALPMKECADAFRQAAAANRGLGAKLGETAAKLMGNNQAGFFTPSFDSPFAAVDGVPEFSVGVYIAKSFGGGTGAGTAVHLYVDEGSGRRQAQLVSPHGLGGGGRSTRLLHNFLAEFRDRDNSLIVEDGNI